LNELIDVLFRTSDGRSFHSLIDEGRNEL